MEAWAPAHVEATLKYHPWSACCLTAARDPGPGPCMAGSLTGAVASPRVTEGRGGGLRVGGNQPSRARAQARLTARATARAETKVGPSDPVVPRGRAIAQRIKGTPGITGLSRPRVHIDGAVWHLDVGLSHPGAGEGPKGPAVRRLKWYMSWVQNVVRQFGLYPSWALEN